MIKLVNLTKYYTGEKEVVKALDNINIEISDTEFVALTGESGSGKSTLLNVISGIDTYEEGVFYINEDDTTYYEQDDWENYRKDNVGFIFQNYNLIESFTCFQNVEMSLIIQGKTKKERKKKVIEYLELVGLKNRLHTRAAKLSGGEKQRLAIARILAKDTKMLVADEPTGNLDSENSKYILEILHKISKNKLVIVVTHNYDEIKEYATRHIRLFDGKVVEDVTLVPVKKEEKPLLLEKPKVKRYKRAFFLGWMNMFSQPKKAFFMLLLSFFSVLFLSLAFSTYTNKRNLINTPVYNKAYFVKSIDELNPNRTIKSDQIKNLKKYGSVYYESRFIEKIGFMINTTSYEKAKVFSIEESYKLQVVLGRTIKNDDEILISNEFFRRLPDDDQLKLKNNKSLELIFDTWFLSKTTKTKYTFKVVGVVRTMREEYIGTNIYVKDTLYNLILFSQKKQQGLINTLKEKFVFEDGVGKIQKLNKKISIYFSSFLNADEIYFNKDLNLFGLYDPNKALIFDGVTLKLNESLDLTKGEKDFFNISRAIVLSDKVLNKHIKEYEPGMVVLNIQKTKSVRSAIKELKQNDLLLKKVSEQIYNPIRDIETFVSVVFLIILVSVIYFISYAIFRVILKSKEAEYKIMKILGLPSSDVQIVIIYEMIFVFLFGFGLVFLIIGLGWILKTSFLYQYYSGRFHGVDILILFLFTLIIFIFIGIRYNRSLKKKKLAAGVRGK